ncbi:hypothetical protein Scep_010507 [Stephania cephalantha]|uniref:Uncharacterized protein n=1 Tax=Stephania cephalantha TaxID=152367 RepID=A0AAP0JV61_9MAGN
MQYNLLAAIIVVVPSSSSAELGRPLGTTGEPTKIEVFIEGNFERFLLDHGDLSPKEVLLQQIPPPPHWPSPCIALPLHHRPPHNTTFHVPPRTPARRAGCPAAVAPRSPPANLRSSVISAQLLLASPLRKSPSRRAPHTDNITWATLMIDRALRESKNESRQRVRHVVKKLGAKVMA